MARPTSLPYTLGKITYSPHPTRKGEVQARGYFVNGNRVRREITARGKSEPSAKRALQKKVDAERDRFRGGTTSCPRRPRSPGRQTSGSTGSVARRRVASHSHLRR